MLMLWERKFKSLSNRPREVMNSSCLVQILYVQISSLAFENSVNDRWRARCHHQCLICSGLRWLAWSTCLFCQQSSYKRYDSSDVKRFGEMGSQSNQHSTRAFYNTSWKINQLKNYTRNRKNNFIRQTRKSKHAYTIFCF